MSRIFITGDIHGATGINRFSSTNFPDGRELTKNDYVIIAGDFGILWTNEPDKQEKYALKWLDNKPWTTLFVDGNHENHFRLNNLNTKEMLGGTVGIVSSSVYHLKRGEIYTINDKTFFCFGGAYSWDIESRTIGISYWSEEIPNHAEMDHGLKNLETVQYSVDYVISHTVPISILEMIGFTKDPNKIDATTKYLDHIANSATYKRWFFGHMHIDRDFSKFRALYRDIEEIL